ncbi:hypothetical protein ACX12L_02705 [Alicycliphilus sp. T452]
MKHLTIFTRLEEMAAAASRPHGQARELVQSVAVLQLDQGPGAGAAPAHAAAALAHAPRGRPPQISRS